MSIFGDLVFLLRGDPKQLNVDVKKAGDTAGDSFGKRMAAGFKKSWSGQNIGKGLVQGLGLAGGLGAVGLATMAISKITDVLGDANAAALAEEVSIQKLGTALKANIPNWDGQTAAIEDVLKARMKLGFSDDEQRESLALIVVATKDVTKALAVQRAAMDLARLKGISLAEASAALIKVEGGQFRALKALGIQLPKNATAEQALTAVQKAAEGQAEDYANTNAGKLLVSQVKVGEALEKLGAVTMPLVTEGTVALADAASSLADAWDVASGKAKATTPEIEQLAFAIMLATKGIELETFPLRTLIGIWQNFFGVIDSVLHILTPWNEEADKAREALNHFADDSVDSVESIKSHAASDLGAAGKSMDALADESGDMAKDIKADNKSVITSWAALKKALKDDVDDLISGAFDPLITKNQLAASNAEAAAARRVIASKTASKAEKAAARDTLDSTVKDQASALVELAEAGMTGSKAYKTGMASLEAFAKTTSGKTRKELDEVIEKIKQVKREGKSVPINIKVAVKGSLNAGNIGFSGARAEGGPELGGGAYWVGERGPEIHVPSTSGRILTASQSAAVASSGGGGGDTIVNLTNNGMPLHEPTPAELVARIRREARVGNIGPSRGGPGWSSI